MPISNLLKASLVIAIGSISGYSVMKYVTKSPDLLSAQNRFVASVPIAKIGQEHIARVLFDLQLETELAKSESNVSTIKVKLEALKNFDNGLSYSWNIPTGVNMIEGPMQDQVGAMKAGEIKYFTLKVNGFSKELKKYLSFEVKGNTNQHSVRRELLVSSRVEDSLEYLVQQGEIKRQQNTINKLGSKKSKFAPENIIR